MPFPHVGKRVQTTLGRQFLNWDAAGFDRLRRPSVGTGFELDPLKAEELGDLIENPGHLRFFILCGDGQTD